MIFLHSVFTADSARKHVLLMQLSKGQILNTRLRRMKSSFIIRKNYWLTVINGKLRSLAICRQTFPIDKDIKVSIQPQCFDLGDISTAQKAE